jgi:hypothetical protein
MGIKVDLEATATCAVPPVKVHRELVPIMVSHGTIHEFVNTPLVEFGGIVHFHSYMPKY